MKKKGLVWGTIILVLLLLIGITFVIYKQILKNDKSSHYGFTDISYLNDFLNDINNLNYDWDSSSIQLELSDFKVNNQVSDIKLILNEDIDKDGTFYFNLYVNDYFVPIANNSKLMALNVELKNNMLMFIGNTGKQDQNINLYLVDLNGKVLLESYDVSYKLSGNLLSITDYTGGSLISCMESDFNDEDIVSEITTYQLGYSSINLFSSESITYGEYCNN